MGGNFCEVQIFVDFVLSSSSQKLLNCSSITRSNMKYNPQYSLAFLNNESLNP